MPSFNLSLSQDPGNTLNNAYDLGILTIPITLTEFIGVTDTTDIYKFSLDKISDLNLVVDGLSDSYLKADLIYDFNNNGQIDSKDYLNNYSISQYYPQEIKTTLGIGKYFLRLAQESNDVNTNYHLTFNNTPTALSISTDPGSILANAYNLGTLNTSINVTEFIGVSDPKDIYKFYLDNISNFNITLDRLNNSSYLKIDLLYDQNNNGQIDNNDSINYDYVYSSERGSIENTLGAGTYFIKIEQDEDNTNTPYTLNINTTRFKSSLINDPGEQLTEAFDIGQVNNNYVIDSRDFNEFIGNTDERDIYKFTLNHNSNISLHCSDLEDDSIKLELVYDLNNNGQIDYNDVLESEYVSSYSSGSIDKTLGAGTYFVNLQRNNTSTNTKYYFNLTSTVNQPDTVVNLKALNSVISEATKQTGIFRISREGDASKALTINYTVVEAPEKAIAIDYSSNLNGLVTIPAGENFVDLSLTAINDLQKENDEQITLKLNSVNNGALIGESLNALITIQDDDRYKPTIFRFYNSNLSSHFYTASEVEKKYIQENFPQYRYEGMSYTAASEIADSLTGVKPVYRFYNNTTGVHLYTMSEVEKDYILTNLSNYRFENVAYHAYETKQENTIPLYRFYHTLADVHFFTPSVVEKDSVLENLPWYRLEGNQGVAFYVEETTQL